MQTALVTYKNSYMLLSLSYSVAVSDTTL